MGNTYLGSQFQGTPCIPAWLHELGRIVVVAGAWEGGRCSPQNRMKTEQGLTSRDTPPATSPPRTHLQWPNSSLHPTSHLLPPWILPSQVHQEINPLIRSEPMGSKPLADTPRGALHSSPSHFSAHLSQVDKQDKPSHWEYILLWRANGLRKRKPKAVTCLMLQLWYFTWVVLLSRFFCSAMLRQALLVLLYKGRSKPSLGGSNTQQAQQRGAGAQVRLSLSVAKTGTSSADKVPGVYRTP